jgi:putative copper export protein/mono/diheme cytochrome c family protein
MYAVLKAVHFGALMALGGGVVFWLAVWRPVYGNAVDAAAARAAKRIRFGVSAAAVLFALSGLAEGLRAAGEVVDLSVSADVWLFLTASRYGQMALLKAVLAPAFAALFVVTQHRVSRTGVACTGAFGLAIAGAVSLTSHAAARPDVIPFCSDIVHVLAAVVWGGGLLCFAVLPWRLLRGDLAHHTRLVGRLVRRFSALALGATLALATTGAVAAFLHVYGPETLTITPYGRALLGKLIVFAFALGIAAAHLLVISPALTRQARRFAPDSAARHVRRLQVLVQIEAGLILCGMALAGVLTTYTPAERPGHIVRRDWQRRVGPLDMHLAMSPTNDTGGVMFDVTLSARNGRPIPPESTVSLYMRMVDHDMGLSDMSAEPVGAGRYAATGLVSMAGDWQVQVTVQPPESAALRIMVDFTADTGALDLGRLRRVELAAIMFSLPNLLSYVLGTLLTALAVFMLWAGQRRRLPLWAAPVGLALFACGAALCLRVVLVDAYPTSYVTNPLPSGPAVVQQGAALFRTHCMPCHGPAGRGDGPAAASLDGPPADLTAEHVDDHTDGDIFWWLTYGMAGTAMPGFEDTLSDTERWQLIRFVRSLREPPSSH